MEVGHTVTMTAIEVTLMSDYGAESPLWVGGMIYPARLGLSAELSARLLAWEEHFLAHSDDERGWSSADREWYAEQVAELAHSLRQELPRGAVVHVNLWPLKDHATPL